MFDENGPEKAGPGLIVTALNSSAVATYNTYYSAEYPALYVTAMRSGNVVTLSVGSNSNYEMAKNRYIVIGTIAEKYRPRWATSFAVYDYGASNANNAMIAGIVRTNGSVEIWIYSDAPNSNGPRGCACYCV